MKRNYSSRATVPLPVLNAFQATALATSLGAAALDDSGTPLALPSFIQDALDEMKADLADLQKTLGSIADDDPELRAADTTIDRIIGALIRVLREWAELAEDIPEGQAAERVLGHLDDETGLAFISWKAPEEWAAIEAKLQTIQREQLEGDLGAIGVLPILQALKAAHLRYGEVTGITKPRPEPDSKGIREKFYPLRDSIRQYVAAITGSIHRKKPETQALADKLLKPLTEWSPSKPPKKKAAEPPAEPPKTESTP